uniref:carbamoyl phosphate synthase small subunit n=1 Tax=Hypnea brasiliensis TaxID=1866962 RepID=UPI0023F1EE5B|nr:carbamoyl phosphate synthase small subunit [Hypnea brasiliensis]WCH55251.1 carbamoyl phosphate synthase small subunit [Hypnea brasiliensis]WDY84770.1 carbamoyl phosphate synthase small subunit [Hypnea brasiliensis]
MKQKNYPAMLLLEDGTQYYGWSLLNSIESIGEVVFNTGLTGYQEIITDPSYTEQIIIFTYPEIGNTGINEEDNEAKKIYIKGIIAKNICHQPSNWRYTINFIDYLIENKIPHIFGIDTRALTKHIRNNGVMNGYITNKILSTQMINNMIKTTAKMTYNQLVDKVTTKHSYISSKEKPQIYSHLNQKIHVNNHDIFNIAVIDLGVKQNIISRLINRGCNITILPANSNYHTIKKLQVDGIVLSNGPGDPSYMIDIVNNIKDIINFCDIPIFGICMGHQILSLAFGGQTFKLKFGHRGLNHPAGMNQQAEITSQNHGFAVKFNTSLSKQLAISHFNLNDSTIAGIIHKDKPIFSVQYHPEASPGPHDSEYLFNHFIHLIKESKINK